MTAGALEALNGAQYQAVTSTAKHLLVLAGAGSGKTRVLVQRFAWLIDSYQLTPHRVLAVTFTNKSAQEMRHRIEDLLGVPAHSLWVGTFHGLSHRILRQYSDKVGLPAHFQIIDSDDQLRLIKRLVRERGWDEEDCEPKRVQSFINRQKDEGKRASHVGPSPMMDISMFTEIYRLYEQHCERTGCVDFAEILLRVYELWRQDPEILAQFQGKFAHILVDEFQDTNTIQYAWLKLLCGPDNHLMIVGDDDQSIYGWRGAKIENIRRFSKDFPDVTTIRLEQNYRSTKTILEAANSLILNNASRLGKDLWTQANQGERIALYGAFNEMDEARFIVDEIHKWCDTDGTHEEIAILYRSNAQSRVLEQALRQANLPYRIYGGLRFFDRAEIKDIIAYLRLLSNKDDDTAFERVINVPPRGIGERTLQVIRAEAQTHTVSLWQAAERLLASQTTGRAATGLRQFFEAMTEMIGLIGTLSLPTLVEYALKKTGFMAHVRLQPGEKTQGRLENLQELVQACAQFQQSYETEAGEQGDCSTALLPAFLSEVALDATQKGQEAEQGIKLMTLHSAKGLEFPLVFLAGMEDGLFPHHRSIHDQSLLEEERRLCYVGITRAMRKLVMTYAEKRAFSGLSGMSRPSRFIQEIPSTMIEPVFLNTKMRLPPSQQRRQALKSDFPFKLGQQVSHPRFGPGVVLAGDGEGEAARVQVNFASCGKKWLVLSYAKLVDLSE